MIVADACVLATLLLPGPEALLIEEVVRLDGEWHVPALWRSELRSVLLKQLRAHALSFEQAVECLVAAEAFVGERTAEPDPVAVLELAQQSGCSSYDCEYVDLARRLRVPLVTHDRQLLRAFPDWTVAPDEFLAVQEGGG